MPTMRMSPSCVGLLCLVVLTVLLSSTSVRSEDANESKKNLRGLQGDSFPEIRPRIIGGQKASDGRYPYYALMSGKSLCGATLISPRFVLTAAHCSEADQFFHIGPETFDGGVKVGISDRAVHPLYNEFTYENDLALFELADDAMVKNSNGELVPAPFVQLSPEEIFVIGTEMTVIGFGDVNPEEAETEFSDTMQEVTVNFVDSNECRRDHRGEITREMMCAEADGQDACYGDSGGPLLMTPTDNLNDDRMVGVVSWGRGCANPDFPGVYTRISYFYDWIVGTMCVLNWSNVPSYVDCAAIMGIDPSELPPGDDDAFQGIREEDIEGSANPSASPSTSPTASPTVAPTRSPSSIPTDTPVAPSTAPTQSPSASSESPVLVPTEPPVALCRNKGDVCVDNGDCCSKRCNFFSKRCSSPANANRERLSSGLGGSAGGSIQRGKQRVQGTIFQLP